MNSYCCLCNPKLGVVACSCNLATWRLSNNISFVSAFRNFDPIDQARVFLKKYNFQSRDFPTLAIQNLETQYLLQIFTPTFTGWGLYNIRLMSILIITHFQPQPPKGHKGIVITCAVLLSVRPAVRPSILVHSFLKKTSVHICRTAIEDMLLKQ